MLPNNNQLTPVRAERTWVTPQPALPWGATERPPRAARSTRTRPGSRGRAGGDTLWEGPIPPGLPRPRDPSIPGAAPGTARGAQRSRLPALAPPRLCGDTPRAASSGSRTGIKSSLAAPLQPAVRRGEGHPGQGSAGPRAVPRSAPQVRASARPRSRTARPGPRTAPPALPAATHRSRAGGSSPSPGRAPPAAAPQPCPPPAARD